MTEKYYRLFELAKDKNIDKAFKARQKLSNLFLKPKKEKNRNMPKILVDGDNKVQQADLLYLPHDGDHKYVLVVVDLGSRLTDAEPLKNKESAHIVEAFKKIYKRGVLKMPGMIQTDPGSEFKGETKKYFKENECFIRYGKPGRHRQQALAESRNKIIGDVLIKRMVSQELLTGEYSVEWVEDLPVVIKAMNEHYPNQKPKIDNNALPYCEKETCDILEPGTKVRVVLDEPRDIKGKKEHGKFRSADMRWENDITEIDLFILKPQQPPMYLTKKYPHVAYTRQQIQVVPENEENPPDSVLRGKASKGTLAEKVLKNFDKAEKKVRFKDLPEEVEEVPEVIPEEEEIETTRELIKKPKPKPKNIYAKKFEKPRRDDKKNDRDFWRKFK